MLGDRNSAREGPIYIQYLLPKVVCRSERKQTLLKGFLVQKNAQSNKWDT